MSIYKHIQSLGIEIPKAPPSIATYIPFQIHKDTIYISGQLPMRDGALAFKGKVGDDISEDDAIQAAACCALNILAQLEVATSGNLDRIQACLKLTGFVNAVPDFTQHPKIINGASDFIGKVFGDKGRHSRAAVGVGSLPLGAPVEVDGLFVLAP